VLAVAVGAVLAGARSFAAIGDWAAELLVPALARLGMSAAPEESTLRKLFARLDADILDRQVGAFVWTRTHLVGGRRVIALDGKTVRGARGRGWAGRAAPGGGVRPELVKSYRNDNADDLGVAGPISRRSLVAG
jgi:hypothetical protein